jgi:hypothetical protein
MAPVSPNEYGLIAGVITQRVGPPRRFCPRERLTRLDKGRAVEGLGVRGLLAAGAVIEDCRESGRHALTGCFREIQQRRPTETSSDNPATERPNSEVPNTSLSSRTVQRALIGGAGACWIGLNPTSPSPDSASHGGSGANRRRRTACRHARDAQPLDVQSPW